MKTEPRDLSACVGTELCCSSELCSGKAGVREAGPTDHPPGDRWGLGSAGTDSLKPKPCYGPDMQFNERWKHGTSRSAARSTERASWGWVGVHTHTCPTNTYAHVLTLPHARTHSAPLVSWSPSYSHCPGPVQHDPGSQHTRRHAWAHTRHAASSALDSVRFSGGRLGE